MYFAFWLIQARFVIENNLNLNDLKRYSSEVECTGPRMLDRMTFKTDVDWDA